LFTVNVKTWFWASHQLTLPDGSKEKLHHHNWEVAAELGSGELDTAGMVVDFCSIEAMLNEIVADFDNVRLEKVDYFRKNSSSAEHVAKYIYEKLKPKLPENLELRSITVAERPGCRAGFGR